MSCEKHVDPAVLPRRDETDLAVGQVVFGLRASVVGRAPLVGGLDDFISYDDMLIAKAQSPRIRCRGELLGAEVPLEPAVEVMHTMCMPPDGRENLPLCGALGGIEGNPSAIIEPQRRVKTFDIVGVSESEVALERFEQSRTKLFRGFPEH